jgi:DNA primase
MPPIRLTPQQIEAWVARHFEYQTRRGGEELVIRNPFIRDDKFKFNISTKLKEISTKEGKISNYWVHDWRPTEAHHNSSFFKFVQKVKGCTFPEAVKDVLGEGVDLRAILYNARPKKIEEEPEPEVIFKLPDQARPITDESLPKARQCAINYLASRCVTYEDAKSFKIFYTPTMVVFPYLEYDMIVYWQGRTTIGKRFEFPDAGEAGRGKSDYLYGFDFAEPGGQVYVTESIFGALSLGPGGLASGGAQMQARQIRKIRALNPSSVVLAPDNDVEGIRSLRPNFQLISPYCAIKYVLPPAGIKDWNEMDQKLGAGSARRFMLAEQKPLTLVGLLALTMKPKTTSSD